MIRTVISIDNDEKRWLDRKAKEEGTTMTEVVRKAIKQYRLGGRKPKGPGSTYAEVLEMTKGTWTNGDAVEWVRKMRSDEWR
jgi:hypothetical protein